MIRYLLVFDMTDTKAAKDDALLLRFEKQGWNRRIRRFLEQHGFHDPEQDGRSETRWLRREVPTKDQLLPILFELENEY
jgi:hypothetical protein